VVLSLEGAATFFGGDGAALSLDAVALFGGGGGDDAVVNAGEDDDVL